MSRHWFIRKHSLFLFVLPLILGKNLTAAEISPLQKPDGPVSITAEKMTLKNLEGRIIFEQAVSIKKGDLTIDADHAEVFLSASDPSSPPATKTGERREISKIVASGNVAVKKGLQRAKAEKGIYDRTKEVIVLTGKPEVWDADYNVKGKTITFFIAEERTLVSESEVVIYNDSEEFALSKGLN